VVCGLVVTLSTSLVKADQISGSDPKVEIGGDPPSAPAGLITLSFGILTPSGTSPATSPCILMQGTTNTSSPDCFFENDITVNGVGETIHSLTFDAVGIAPSTATCGFLAGSPFSSCGIDELPNGRGTAFSFDVGSIPFHDNFTLDFQGFPKDFQFTVQGTVVPEPGTLALLLSGMGLAGLWVRRKVRTS
jgi:hypothetical protein